MQIAQLRCSLIIPCACFQARVRILGPLSSSPFSTRTPTIKLSATDTANAPLCMPFTAQTKRF